MKPITIKSESQILAIALFSSNLVVSAISFATLDMRSATNLISGALFLTFNLIFYATLSAAILIKKNIAWMGPVIVIKYLFLIAAVYLVWTYSDVLLVLSGMFMELFIVICTYMILQRGLLRRDIKNGSL